MKIRQRLRRWHIWLGWIVGLPFLAWTVSGLVMVARPIETVRGRGPDRRGAGACRRGSRRSRPRSGRGRSPRFGWRRGPTGPRWLLKYADGGTRLADAATGRLLPPLAAADAARIVEARYKGKARIAAVDRTSARGAAARLSPQGRRLAGDDERRHPLLSRCRDRRDPGPADALVALLRPDVGHPHHGPGDPRGRA